MKADNMTLKFKTSYTIEIDEIQRLAIIRALQTDLYTRPNDMIYDPVFPREEDNLDVRMILRDMLTDMPEVEREHPDIIHGFSL